MAIRAVASLAGLVFGFLLAWSGMSDPVAVRRMLLLDEAYLFLVFSSAVAVAFLGLRVLTRVRAKALLTDEAVSWTTGTPERRHVVGSALFGVGWAVSSSCPGPIAAQLGQGIVWSVFTIAGIFLGLLVYARQTAGARTSAKPSEFSGQEVMVGGR